MERIFLKSASFLSIVTFLSVACVASQQAHLFPEDDTESSFIGKGITQKIIYEITQPGEFKYDERLKRWAYVKEDKETLKKEKSQEKK